MFPSPVRRGFALIELLMVLGIGVLMLSAVWAANVRRTEDVRVEQSFVAIDQFVRVADDAYATSPGYWFNGGGGGAENVSLAHLRDVGFELPEGVIDLGGGAFANPWAGTWSIDAESSTGTARDLIAITLTDVPTQSCISLVSRMAPRVYDTHVNNSLVGLSPARTVQSLGRNAVRLEQTIPLCQQAKNTIKFRQLKQVDYTLLRDQPMNPNVLSARETTDYLPVFQRVEQALDDREAAQVAIP